MNKFVRFVKDESGATAIEYGLIAAAMGLMLVATMPLISTAIQTTFTTLAGAPRSAVIWLRLYLAQLANFQRKSTSPPDGFCLRK
jgi:pilus assembly protein Flp/PilA